MFNKICQLIALIIVIIVILIPLGFAVDEINAATNMHYAEYTIE